MAENTYNGAVLAQSWKQVFKLWDQSGAKDARSKYIDFPYIFALVKTKLACGKGYSFNSENPRTSELFKKLELDSRFQEKINLLLYNIYYYGIAYGGFDRLANVHILLRHTKMSLVLFFLKKPQFRLLIN